jgi:RNA polymerase subunit RPABC4/transcription elongation factor Spt4
MFLIAGVSPKTKILDNNPRRCPVCGLARAYYKRVDHYFNLFFIPILRVKKGEPFIMCDRCERTVHEFEQEYTTFPAGQDTMCKSCGKDLHRDFKYCPFCGKPTLNE